MLVAFAFSIVLIKTSLLGLSGLTIVLAACFLLLIKRNIIELRSAVKTKFCQLYQIALITQLFGYLILLAKLLLIDGWHDLPLFIASHIVIHHVWSAFIAATLTVMTIVNYLQLKAQQNAI
ncbi:hypothetical protein [Pseudoalteromonas peptidolytica]|uniref:hypothetical protein n=1 Tax=Pseudoalteromonas peptidolytica TaxID=61150 RepID=UPI00298DEE1F|nr:hypothetical protein [Pseudoalteromonas peptidolytica]MDW7547429.1 hypothetical protein [Pseudoalteromonas peptidolytica]